MLGEGRGSQLATLRRPWSATVPLVVAVLVVAARASALQRVYVANMAVDSVAVVDLDRGSVLRAIPVGHQPDGLAISRDGSRLYVSNYASGTVSIVDTDRDAVVATVPVGAGPVGLTLLPDGSAVYVANKDAGSVSVIDTATATVAATIDVGAATGPNAVAASPDGRQVWVTRSHAGELAIVDTVSQRVVDNLYLGAESNRIVAAGIGQRAYVVTGHCVSGGRYPRKLLLVDVHTRRVDPLIGLDDSTGVALGRDHGAVFGVFSSGALQRLDLPDRVSATTYLGAGLAGIGYLPSRRLVLAVNPARGELIAVSDDFDSRQASVARHIPLGGAPFALVALPHEDRPELNAAILRPALADKLEPDAATSVRITVTAGAAALRDWRLTLRDVDLPSQESELARGSKQVLDAAVATIDATQLAHGTYALTLEASAVDGRQVVRDTRVSIPDRQYVLVPLEPQVDPSVRYEIDAAGDRFVGWVPNGGAVTLYEAATGARSEIDMPAPLRGTVDLSRDGRRVIASSPLTVLDLDTRVATLQSYTPLHFDVDASGRWLAGFTLRGMPSRYQLRDVLTGETQRVSDRPMLHDPPLTCNTRRGCTPTPWLSNAPHLSADGKRLVFVSGADFGFAGAARCNVFSYDRDSGAIQLVRPIDDLMVDLPSLDDDGAQLGMLLFGRAVPPRAVVVDVASGAQRDVLAGRPVASMDATMVGDGSGIVISSCADLDPSVGNADGNAELFRVDLGTGHIAQITDTIGGSSNCSINAGGRYGAGRFRPEVSHDGRAMAFNLAGAQRDVRSGLSFGAVRTVRRVDGDAPPRVDVHGTLATLVGGGLELDFEASDPDGDAVSYFMQLDDSPALPQNVWVGVRDLHGDFGWDYPAESDIGAHTLLIGAFDGRGGQNIRRVPLAICRRIISTHDRASIVSAIFDPQAPGCGSADANGDGVVSIADLMAAGS